MTKAVCSGSFDPVTMGHLDIFLRGAKIFDELIVCVFTNVRKQSFFSVEERIRLLKDATSHIKNLRVDSFSGLVTDYMKETEAHTLLRGIRSYADLEYEEREARMVNYLDNDIETVFLLTNPKYSHISSSAIRELAAFNTIPVGLVPKNVEKAIEKKLANIEKRD